jgi:hypothetical protein
MLKKTKTETKNTKTKHMGGIQDGDEREEADSMNSVNKKSC